MTYNEKIEKDLKIVNYVGILTIVFFIGIFILPLPFILTNAQDTKPLASPPPVAVTLPIVTEPKAITLTEAERQPFITILNRIELSLTQKQLIEARIEIDQRNFRDTVEALKKARGCSDCTFDAQKLELVPPPPKPTAATAPAKP